MSANRLRPLRIVEALAGNEVFGQTLTEIVKELSEPVDASSVLRDLQALEEAGWTQQLPDKKWRLAAKPIQIFTTFQWGLQNAAAKVEEVRHNYTRTH
jgi:DNA-binding IclR family transcriptional regulator